jgi:hypothetical protein
MSNLENFNNIFANLAESAYNKRPNNFPYDELKKEYKGKIDDGESIDFNFSEDYVDKKQIKLKSKVVQIFPTTVSSISNQIKS